jgi:5-methylcytosine-specific restriction endonuclease McrA
MKEPTIIEYCLKRDGVICGICKDSIEEDIKMFREYLKLQAEIKRQKRELQKKVIDFRKRFIHIDIDHIIPRSKSGANDKTNYQVTHKKCNNKKGNSYENKELENE